LWFIALERHASWHRVVLRRTWSDRRRSSRDRLWAQLSDGNSGGGGHRRSYVPWNVTRSIQSSSHRSVRSYRDGRFRGKHLSPDRCRRTSAAQESTFREWERHLRSGSRPRKARLAAFAANQRHIVDAPILIHFSRRTSRAGRAISDERRTSGKSRSTTIEASSSAIATLNSRPRTRCSSGIVGRGGIISGAMATNRLVADELALPDEALVVSSALTIADS